MGQQNKQNLHHGLGTSRRHGCHAPHLCSRSIRQEHVLDYLRRVLKPDLRLYLNLGIVYSDLRDCSYINLQVKVRGEDAQS
jgi:hypothetical protein